MDDTPVLLRNRDTNNIFINRFYEVGIHTNKNLEVWSRNGWKSIDKLKESNDFNLFEMKELSYSENEVEEDVDFCYLIKKAKCYGFFMKWGEKSRSHWYLKHNDLDILKRFKAYFQEIYQTEFDLLDTKILTDGFYILVPREPGWGFMEDSKSCLRTEFSETEKKSYSQSRIPEFVLNGSKWIKIAFLDGYNTGQPVIPNKYILQKDTLAANMYYLLKSLGKDIRVTLNDNCYILSEQIN